MYNMNDLLFVPFDIFYNWNPNIAVNFCKHIREVNCCLPICN